LVVVVVRRGGGGSPRESGKDWLATAGENTVADCGWLHEEELSTLHACVCLYGKKNYEGAWFATSFISHGLSAQMSSGGVVRLDHRTETL
jgi:hypothetical protein